MLSHRLKDETQHMHRAIDQHALLSKLMSNTLTLSEYRDALVCLYDWHRAIEHIVYTKDVLALGLRMQPKHPNLLHDLQNICPFTGHVPATVAMEELDLAEKLGFIYVIEGATLGGQILGPKVAKTLKRDDITHYYSIYGSATRENFMHNMQLINTLVCSPKEQSMCIKSAQKGFDMLNFILNTKFPNCAA